jgi:hypothetical protein
VKDPVVTVVVRPVVRAAVLLAAVLVATLAARAARACTQPPKALTVHHSELVRRAPRIALARFEKATPFTSGECSAAEPCYKTEFSTVEVLKGPVPPRFSLLFTEESPRHPEGAQPFKDRPGADFHGHTDWEFWDSGTTREGNGSDCEMHPRFELGARYLIFLGGSHWRAFERIDRPDDRWLRAVRALLAKPSSPSGLSMSLADYIADQRGLFVGEIVACHLAGDRASPSAHEVKVREVLFGKVPRSVRMRSLIRSTTRCEPGLRVVGVIHRSSAFPGHTNRRPPGRLLPLNAAGVVDFDAEPSEAVIVRDGPVTLDALRALAAARRGH